MERPAHVRAFIDSYLTCARSVELFFRIPVSVTLAYAASESDWGRSSLARLGIIFGEELTQDESANISSIKVLQVINRKQATTYFKKTSKREAFLAYAENLRTNPLLENALRYVDNPERFLEIIATGFENGPDKQKAQTARILLKEYRLKDLDSWLYVDLFETVLHKI